MSNRCICEPACLPVTDADLRVPRLFSLSPLEGPGLKQIQLFYLWIRLSPLGFRCIYDLAGSPVFVGVFLPSWSFSESMSFLLGVAGLCVFKISSSRFPA
ncbi:hypothetical protein HRI_003134400 [Hibiscus trionum]|uniref:Uncharacterized protein n=1 Tax=Hibiscus trionum TaxID=183268 RepID=A0A9W7IG52_HIBTR|nr:hypothetical protein HRI_003134400 [Hibiscus trionum]